MARRNRLGGGDIDTLVERDMGDYPKGARRGVGTVNLSMPAAAGTGQRNIALRNRSSAISSAIIPAVVGLLSWCMGRAFAFAFRRGGRHAIVGLPSCRAGTYFRCAAKVGKGAPKGEETPFMAGFLPPLETLIIPAGRGTPPGCARGLTAKSGVWLARAALALGLFMPAPREPDGVTLQ